MENKSLGEKKGLLQQTLSKLFSKRQARKFARSTKRSIRNALGGFGREAKESKDMAMSFFKMLENKLDLYNRTTPPSKEEVKEAIEQLKDIGRFSLFASISIIPGGGFSLIGLELLARKFGIKRFTFVPSGFRKKGRKFKARSFGRKEMQQEPPVAQSEIKVRAGSSV